MVKIKKAKWIIAFGVLALGLSACGNPNATLTPPPTRAVTQTPWIIYVPVTTTPEPTLLPLLPTAESKTTAVPTRAPTRVVAKPTVVPTKPAAPVASVAKPTAAPTCNYGTVTLREPDDNALRQTKEVGVGGDTFRFIWDPPESLIGSTDSTVGYQLNIVSKRPSFSNGTTIYISNNAFLNSSPPKLFILDKPAVSTLAAGADVNVTWNVSIVKTTGGFNESDPTIRPPGLVTCGSPSPTRTINLKVF
jgi:hypothetical protein